MMTVSRAGSVAGAATHVSFGASPHVSIDAASAGIVAAVGVALIGTDLEGTVTVWNPAAEALYGWTAAEALGRSVLELTPVPEGRLRRRRCSSK